MAAMNWSEDLSTIFATIFHRSNPPIPAILMAFTLMIRAPKRDLRPFLMTRSSREEIGSHNWDTGKRICPRITPKLALELEQITL